MKKIFTFLFFAALISSAAMAQDRHSQYRNPSGDNRDQSPVYQGDNGRGYSSSFQNHNGYQGNDHRYNQGRENVYGYNNDRRYEDRAFYSRYPVYGHRKIDNEWYRHNRSHVLLSIHFGRRSGY
jgi:hypothetical protein